MKKQRKQYVWYSAKLNELFTFDSPPVRNHLSEQYHLMVDGKPLISHIYYIGEL